MFKSKAWVFSAVVFGLVCGGANAALATSAMYPPPGYVYNSRCKLDLSSTCEYYTGHSCGYGVFDETGCNVESPDPEAPMDCCKSFPGGGNG